MADESVKQIAHVMLNAGRGNPNWIATEAREAFFILGMRIMAFSYFIAPLMDCSIAASRGLGRSVAPTMMVILGSCVFRVIWIYTIFAYFHTITSLYLLYMFSWILTGVAEYIYFRITYKRNVLTARATW